MQIVDVTKFKTFWNALLTYTRVQKSACQKAEEIKTSYLTRGGGPGSSVGIATDYRPDGPGSNPGGDFPPIQTGPGVQPASCKIGTRSFPRVKLTGRGFDHQPQSSAEVKERVQLYLYSP